MPAPICRPNYFTIKQRFVKELFRFRAVSSDPHPLIFSSLPQRVGQKPDRQASDLTHPLLPHQVTQGWDAGQHPQQQRPHQAAGGRFADAHGETVPRPGGEKS